MGDWSFRAGLIGLSFVVFSCAPSAPSRAARSGSSNAPAPPRAPNAVPFPRLGEQCSRAAKPFDFSRVRVLGRSEQFSDGLAFEWSGTALGFHFRGTSFDLELADSGRNRFGVEIDGVTLPHKLEAHEGAHCYRLAQGLSPGDHRITVTRLTEAMLGESRLISAETSDGGELFAAEPGPERRVEFIGDSITAAYGVEGKDRNCHFSPDTENASLSYASIFGRRAHAEVRLIAWSGKGVFSNRGSDTDTAPMPELWQRTLPTRQEFPWAWLLSGWSPDAVVIELGTNDFAPENKDRSPFVTAYAALIARVREVYPKAAIFCALGPLFSDDWPPNEHTRSTARDGIRAAMARLTDHGVERVFFLEHAPETEAEGWGCDWHPNRVTHERMAGELFDSFAKNLGW